MLTSSIHNGPPSGFVKILYFNWILLLLVCVVVGIGLMTLYSVAGGDAEMWMQPQALRFGLGLVAIFVIAFLPSVFLKMSAPLFYILVILLLIYTQIAGQMGGGAARWIQVGGLRLQPSEFMKLALVAVLASYYAFLEPSKTSQPFYVIIPVLLIMFPAILILSQPDLGTSLFVVITGFSVMFLAGVSLWYFIIGGALGASLLTILLKARDPEWWVTQNFEFLRFFQLKDYQYARIDVFLNPELDPSGKGYHIIQSKIALGSGGISGRGWMQGSQSQLNFLPETQTDFIFTSYAESFGFIGTIVLLGLFALITLVIAWSAFRNRDRFGALTTSGVGIVFSLFYAVNMAMVMGLIPVVGVPLPFVSWGGSAMLVLCMGIGYVQNAHINRPRGRMPRL